MKQRLQDLSIIREEVREHFNMRFTYTLLTDNGGEQTKNAPLYTVKITLERDGRITKGEARDAFSDGGKAICFFNSLVKNLATPIDLCCIVDDGISG